MSSDTGDGNADWPTVTDHAAVRHRERRAAGCRLGPRAAWIEGDRLRRPHGLDADEVRYHDGAGVALLRKDDCLVTVIDVATAKPELRRAVRTLEVTNA